MKNNMLLIRTRLGVSQAKMAELLGVSQGNISLCETQNQEVSPELARKIVGVFQKLGHHITFDDIYAVSSDSPDKSE